METLIIFTIILKTFAKLLLSSDSNFSFKMADGLGLI